MTLRNVVGLYLVRLRGRFGQELLAFVGIAVGVALLFAALVANTSLSGSFERVAKGMIGDARIQVSARGSATIPETLLADTQRVPGVRTAAASLEVPVEVIGPQGRRSVVVIGLSPDFADLGNAFAGGFSYGFLGDVRAIGLPAGLAEGLGLALGQPVRLEAGDRSVEARLGAKLQRDDIGTLVNSSAALAPLRYAQELTGDRGRLTRIFVVPDPGQEGVVRQRLTELVGAGVNVRPADFDGALFQQAAAPTSQSTAMFSVFGAMVGFLFAFSAMLLTVPHRRQLITDLDVEGYGIGTVVKVLLFDALVLGISASAAGIVLGDLVARALFDGPPSFLQYAFTVGPERIVAPSNVVIASAGGIAASCIAVLGPTATSLWRSRETRAPRRARRRLDGLAIGGLTSLMGGVAIIVVAPASALAGIVGLALLALSMLLLLPALLRLLVGLVSFSTQNVRSVVPFLAIFDLRDPTAHLRTLAVAATGAIAIFGSVALQGAHADLLRGLDRTSEEASALGDVWVVAPGAANLLVTTPFAPPSLSGAEGIEDLRIYRGGFLDVGDRRVRVFGVPGTGRQPVFRGQLLQGDPDEVARQLPEGGSVVLSEGVARELGVGVGDRFTLPSAVPTSFRVAALATNLGWPPGSIVMNAADYARAWGSEDASAILATRAPGTTLDEARQALRDELGPRSTLDVYTSDERTRDQQSASRDGVARLAQIASLVLVSAIIAMAAAMGGLIWQRRRFLAALKVEGYQTSELWQALLLEASVLIGAGCAIGAAFGLLGQRLLSRALTSVTGFPVVYSAALGAALVTSLVVTAAAVAIVGIFGQRAASVTPHHSLSG